MNNIFIYYYFYDDTKTNGWLRQQQKKTSLKKKNTHEKIFWRCFVVGFERCWLAESATRETAAMRTNLIVNYLPQNMTEKELYAMFCTVGALESCRVMKDYKVKNPVWKQSSKKVYKRESNYGLFFVKLLLLSS